MKNLNSKERAVLDCIRRGIAEKGYAPSVRDIAEMLGYRSTSTVQMYLDRLLSYGILLRESGKSRSLRVSENDAPPVPSLSARAIPVLKEGVILSRSLTEDCFEGAFHVDLCEGREEKALVALSAKGNTVGLPDTAMAIVSVGSEATRGAWQAICADGRAVITVADGVNGSVLGSVVAVIL